MRKRIYQIIECTEEHDIAATVYSFSMIAVILASLVPLCTKSEAQWTAILDRVTVTVFIIDYLLRLATADFKYPGNGALAFVRYPFSAMAIIDLLSILPSFGMFASGLKVLKVFRLFRTLKVFKALKAFKAFKALKVLRYSKSITIIVNVIRSQKEALITVGGLAICYILIAAIIAFNVEPETFNTFFDAIYWSCVSLTTIGYGDIYPVTTAGRIVTMLSSAVGIAIVALPAGIITAGYMSELEEERKKDEKSEDEEEQ